MKYKDANVSVSVWANTFISVCTQKRWLVGIRLCHVYNGIKISDNYIFLSQYVTFVDFFISFPIDA